jgi:hypothetical protein
MLQTCVVASVIVAYVIRITAYLVNFSACYTFSE